jgi:adenylate cyclase
MAEGLLLLKEFGAAAAILDIEYIDRSPTQVNEVYLRDNLRLDFRRRFTGIQGNITDLVTALSGGQLGREDALAAAQELNTLINEEEEGLYNDTLRIVQDNDAFLAQAAASFGETWATVNIWGAPLEGEQAERRRYAEEHFSYPVKVAPNVYREQNADVLPPIPQFMEAIRGAGFTNSVIDKDGIRRRVNLVREVNGYWYLQLALPALMDRLGNPEIELKKGALVLRGIRTGGEGELKDVVIPLDKENHVLIDWPKTSYADSWTHFSFAHFSFLSRLERDIISYIEALSSLNAAVFPASAERTENLLALYAEDTRVTGTFREAAEEICDSLMSEDLKHAENLAFSNPQLAEYISGEVDYAEQVSEYLKFALNDYSTELQGIRDAVAGKTCIIGRVDTGTTDIGANPFFSEYPNPGTHAAVWETILKGINGDAPFIRILSPFWSILLCLLLVITFSLVTTNIRIVWRMQLALLTFVLTIAFCAVLFVSTGLFLSPLIPFVVFFVSTLIREVAAFLHTDQEKRFIRKAFSTYLSEHVVAELEKHPEKLQLGGETRHITALFTDVRGFTSISEKLSAEKLVYLLNDYLSVISNCVLENDGIIDKYEGDAMIAFFNAPLDLPDHAIRACTAAAAIKEAERELNARYLETGMSPVPIWTRIGINTGDAVVGNMGTTTRMDYTMMGHTVNLASRLEGVNKVYGTGVMASESTVLETNDLFLTRSFDRVRVVGLQDPVRIYEILGLMGKVSPELRKQTGLFEEGCILYEKRQWEKAVEIFRSILGHNPDDTPSKLYLSRCEAFLKDPPPPDWDAVVNLTEK